jgi:hypothetical protein
VAERAEDAPHERGLARTEVPIEVNDHSGLEHAGDRGAERERGFFIGQECGEHAGIIEG